MKRFFNRFFKKKEVKKDDVTLKNMLLHQSEASFDSVLKPIVSKWDDEPTPLQILEILDKCIHGGLASGTVISILQKFYDVECHKNNTTHEEVVKNATWRD